MKEQYRIFHYTNGFNLRVENIVDALEGDQGILLTSLGGEKTFIKPGWAATTYKTFVPAIPAPQRDTDGDQAR